jgi:4'-phosphopantetheinyl transferase
LKTPNRSDLRTDEADVWLASLDRFYPLKVHFERLLDPSERARAKVLTAREGTTFTVCRGILRALLGSYLGLDPESIVYVRGQNGKLNLADGMGYPPLNFSLAHSGGSAVFAFALCREVGVDIECTSPGVDVRGISRRFFAPGEYAILKSLESRARLRRFYQIWTLKEAVLKAAGAGLNIALDSIDTSCVGSRKLMTSECSFLGRRLHLRPLSLPRPMVGSLALEMTGVTPRNLRLRTKEVG